MKAREKRRSDVIMADQESAEKRTDRVSTPSGARKPYSAPKLVSYGHVKDVVQGGTGRMNDAPGGASRSCWIAEALYGVDDARTLMLRAFLARVHDERRAGWVFVALYARFGRTIAGMIHQGVLPRQLFLPLFDSLVDRAFADTAHILAAERT